MDIDYENRAPEIAFEEMIDAFVQEGIPLRSAAQSPVLRLLFYAGMVAATGTISKQLRDFRGHYTDLFEQVSAKFWRDCAEAMAKQSEEATGYAIDLDALATTPGRGTSETDGGGAGPERPGSDGDDRLLRRGADDSARDRTGGAETGRRARGSGSVLSQAAGLSRGAKDRESESTSERERRERRELTGNPVVDYWIITGCRICPDDQLEQPLGQLLEAAFYMGASFFGGRVSDTLNLDDAYADELTRETFNFLTGAAIAAMETSGETMLLNGRAYADRDKSDDSDPT